MRFLVLTPPSSGVRTGNLGTAGQWARILRDLGHEADVTGRYDGGKAFDVLVALNASKCVDAVAAARARGMRVVVVLTGTDIYPEAGPEACAAMRAADRIVALQARAPEQVPAELRARVRVIVQGAGPAAPRRETDGFQVCVVAHLREVKDPLRAAAAARLLPPASRVRVVLAGGILDPRYAGLVEREQAGNTRFEWLGEIGPGEVAELFASSRLSVMSSRHEGGSRAIGESVVAGTPVLAARDDAARALLGDDYPGLFEYGATEQLADLLARAEGDPAFPGELHARTARAAPQFEPAREREAWRALVEELRGAPDRPAIGGTR